MTFEYQRWDYSHKNLQLPKLQFSESHKKKNIRIKPNLTAHEHFVSLHQPYRHRIAAKTHDFSQY